MKRLLAVAALAMAAGFSVNAEAQMLGSDTMAELTKDVLAACAESPVITYTGTGSGNGEVAGRNGTQSIATMSRNLTTGNTCAVVAGAGTADQAACKTVALDGLAIVGDPVNAACGVKHAQSANISFTVTDANNNGTVDCAGTSCPSNTYTLGSVFDVLRLVYAGVDKAGGRSTACSANTDCGVTTASSGNRFGHFEANVIHRVDSCVCSDGKPAPCTDAARTCTSNLQCTAAGSACNTSAGLCQRSCTTSSQCTGGGTCNAGFCSGGNAVVTGVCRNTRCNSDERISLLNSWGNMFDCAGGNCTQLVNAFRRGDASGTTDTFSALLGLATITVNPWSKDSVTPYCNGSDLNDWDPVRRPCGASNATVDATGVHDTVTTDAPDDVCGRIGNLGVVLPIVVPESPTGVPASSFTPSVTSPEAGVKMCAPGAFSNRPARRISYPDGTFSFDCPERSYANGSGANCLAPRAADGTFDCMSFPTNVNSQFVSAGNDGRLLNAWARNSLGQLIQAAPGVCSSGTCSTNAQCGTSGGECVNNVCTNGSCIQNSQCGTGGFCLFTPAQRPVVGGYFRLKTPRTTKSPAVPRCGQDTSTEQIGCLVAKKPCSVGFAGREAATGIGPGQGRAFSVGGILPTVDKVQNLLVNPPNSVTSPVYPLSRTLQQCSMSGFAFAANDNYGQLSACLDNSTITETGRRCTAGACTAHADCGTSGGICNLGQCTAGACTTNTDCGTSGGVCPATVQGSVEKAGFVQIPAFATAADRCTDFDERFCTSSTTCSRDAGTNCTTSGGCVDAESTECPATGFCVTAQNATAGRCSSFTSNTNALACARFSH